MDRGQEYYSLVKLPYKIIRTKDDLYYPIYFIINSIILFYTIKYN